MGLKNGEKQTILCLVRICKTTHTTHDTEDVVVDCEDLKNTSNINIGELKSGVINAGEVASAARLVFFGVKGKGIDINELRVILIDRAFIKGVSVSIIQVFLRKEAH